MAKKLAIDWDDGELRLVAAQCSGRSVKVTHASVIPIVDGNVETTLKSAIQSRGLEETPTLVAIGRGRAELRELQLPPVPDDELPDMVRFQAIRSFASAGENANVDYLVTNRNDDGVEMIAAAVAPSSLQEIQTLGQRAGVPIERVSLRPLSAAALYLIHQSRQSGQDTVLIDLLSDDAEIVVARGGHVIFVRTVRMPSTAKGRGRALAGELKRSLFACGSSGSLERVVLWGKESVHVDDIQMLAEASGAEVQALDPFSLVDVDSQLQEELPEHVGRLAPLVGLLAADENDGDRLIDFLNPRKKVEQVPNPYKKAALYGVPVAAAVLIAIAVYLQLRGLDQQIADLKAANSAMKQNVDAASESVQRTDKIDAYLDADVNWLGEIRRLAENVPPAEQLIVRQISGTSNTRNGGGTLRVEGAVTQPAAIDDFEQSLRDENHRVAGDGASEQRTGDAYRWGFVETITVTPSSVRNGRYEAIATLLANEKSAENADTSTESNETETNDADPAVREAEDADAAVTAVESSEATSSTQLETTDDSEIDATDDAASATESGEAESEESKETIEKETEQSAEENEELVGTVRPEVKS